MMATAFLFSAYTNNSHEFLKAIDFTLDHCKNKTQRKSRFGTVWSLFYGLCLTWLNKVNTRGKMWWNDEQEKVGDVDNVTSFFSAED